MRIRWTIGTHYGPEYAPSLLVLAAIPVLIAVLVGAFRAVATVLERADERDAVRGCYELCVLAVLLSLLAGQVALVVANLW